MIAPPEWDDTQLEEARVASILAFSKDRLEEPLEDYLEAFDEYQGFVEEILEMTVDLSDIDDNAIEILGNPKLQECFRYLAAPPISSDDLKTLADVSSLSRSHLESHQDQALRIIEVIGQVLDRRRFAWVSENRDPTEAERNAAVMASAALMANSRTQTKRRNDGKDKQENAVKEALRGLGFTEVASRTIHNVSQAPASGEFCGESVLGTRKGDIIVRLWDGRVMPIECKVSNSATNSVKRLNNDAAVKATSWKLDFGLRQVVPSAVLGGVYKLHNLRDAQERGLAIFWGHDLQPMLDWIESTQP